MGRAIVRRQGQGVPVLIDGLVQLALDLQHIAQIVAGRRIGSG